MLAINQWLAELSSFVTFRSAIGVIMKTLLALIYLSLTIRLYIHTCLQ